MYASLLRISGALHLALFEQPGKDDFLCSLLNHQVFLFCFFVCLKFGHRPAKADTPIIDHIDPVAQFQG
jgi:hypothetical protein